MALDIQTIAMTGVYVPYERPPQNITLWSAIPRGLASFVIDGQALDAKALNDEALLNLQGTLPPNFAYVMQDMNVTIAQDLAENWSTFINLNLQNFYRSPETLHVALAGNWVQDFLGAAQDASTRASSQRQPYPSFPLLGVNAAGVQINISTFNNVAAAAAAGVVNAFISFWQFDLEQIRKYPINSPIPTQSR